MTDWTPSVRTIEDDLSPWPARAMEALLDRPPTANSGTHLPLGWHWLYFHEAVPISSLGADGHPARGTFLPPLDAPRRMWAGGRLQARKPVLLGRPARLVSTVRSVNEKEGRSGRLTFVRVAHEVHQDGLAVEEEQVLVYRGHERSGSPPPPRQPASEGDPKWSAPFSPSRVMLFQFSALTYNAHRIHYDHPYVTAQEGYADLLVHAPLTALTLLDAATQRGTEPASFEYRALAPLFVDETAVLKGWPDGTVRAQSPTHGVVMNGTLSVR